MAFGTELQGQSSQDAEIRLLETVKRSISQRIKCDRAYAVALSLIVTGAQKQDPVLSGLPTHSVG